MRLNRVHRLERQWIKGVDHFTTSIRDMLMHPTVMAKMLILTWVQLTAYFSLAYWVYRAFGFSDYSFISMISLQAVLYLSISLLPAPGSAGVAEGGFFIFFGSVFTAGTLAGAMVVWRGISYYLTLAITGLATLLISMINWSKTIRLERTLNRKSLEQ